MPLYGAPGERISYEVYPASRPGAPAIVLVHGFTASSVSFEANLPGLREHFTVVTADLLGHGASDAPAEVAPYAPEAAVARLLGMFDELGLENVLLCGHSLGAALCLRLALDAPERLAGLIVINSSSAAGTPAWREQAARGMAELAARVRAEGTGFLRKTRLYPAHSKRLDPRSRELLVESFDRLTPEGVAGTAEGLIAPVNSYERLGDLRVPVLVVLGERDADFMQHAPGFVSRLPARLLRTVRLEEAGHAANIEQPEAFERAVVSFASELGLFAPPPTEEAPAAAPAEQPAETPKPRRDLGGTALTALGVTLILGGIGLLVASFLVGRGGDSAQQVAAALPPSPTVTATAVTAIAGTRSAGPNAALTVAASPTSAATAVTPPTSAPSPTVAPATATATRPAPTPTHTATPASTPTPEPTSTAVPSPPATTPAGPVALISGPRSVAAGEEATYVDASSPAREVLGWQWSTSAQVVSQLNPAALVVRFPSPGCYTVSLTAIFPGGNRGTAISVAAGGAVCP